MVPILVINEKKSNSVTIFPVVSLFHNYVTFYYQSDFDTENSWLHIWKIFQNIFQLPLGLKNFLRKKA